MLQELLVYSQLLQEIHDIVKFRSQAVVMTSGSNFENMRQADPAIPAVADRVADDTAQRASMKAQNAASSNKGRGGKR